MRVVVTDMSTVAASRLAKVTVRQLNHWAASGYLHPRREPGAGQGGTFVWPPEEVDRAEMLGILARVMNRPDLFALLAEAIETGTTLVLTDDYYDVVISWRPTKGQSHGTNHGTTEPATA